MNNAIVAMALIAALAFAIVGASSFVAPVFAAGKPSNVPPSSDQGRATGECASERAGQSAQGCHFVPDRG